MVWRAASRASPSTFHRRDVRVAALFDACSRVVTRREEAIETALKAKLEQRRVEREQAQSANRAEIEAFTAEFLNAARECFLMIDKDNSGTLTKTEIVHSVSTDKSVKDFLQNCGEPNLQFLLVPARLEASLDALDTSRDGELDMDECASRGVLYVSTCARRR